MYLSQRQTLLNPFLPDLFQGFTPSTGVGNSVRPCYRIIYSVTRSYRILAPIAEIVMKDVTLPCRFLSLNEPGSRYIQ